MNGFFSKTFRYCFPVFIVCLCIIACVPLVAASDGDLIEDNTEVFKSTEPILEPLDNDIVLTSVDTHIMTVTPNDANGFKKVLLQLFGNYEMITKEYTYTGNNGYTSKQVTTESDYPWMISAAIFAIVLYCLFRLLGGVLCGRK